jgi:hypothetical protein
MTQLPMQIPWRHFLHVLHKLGYTEGKGKRGSVRSFSNPNRSPNSVSFREPHPGDSMGKLMLRRYLLKLRLDPEDFMRLLNNC